jgi:hypothetical protein
MPVLEHLSLHIPRISVILLLMWTCVENLQVVLRYEIIISMVRGFRWYGEGHSFNFFSSNTIFDFTSLSDDAQSQVTPGKLGPVKCVTKIDLDGHAV